MTIVHREHSFPKSTRRRLLRVIAGMVAATMAVAPFTTVVAAARASSAITYTTVNVPSLLVFPFANDAGDSAASIGPRLDDAIILRLNAIGSYKVTRYTKFLPQVQRAVQDRVISSDDAVGPFDDAGKAETIAQQVDTDELLMGAIESYTADPTSGKVSIEVSANLRDVKTGSPMKALAFTGDAAPSSASDTIDETTQSAIDSVAGKIAAAVNAERPSGAGFVPTQRQHNDTAEVFLVTLLTGVLVFAIAHNSQHSSSSSSLGSGGGGSGTSTSVGGPPAPP